MTKRPYVLGGAVSGLGYFSAFVKRTPRAVSGELMRFHRGEQMTKLKAILRALVKFQKLDSFRVMQN